MNRTIVNRSTSFAQLPGDWPKKTRKALSRTFLCHQRRSLPGAIATVGMTKLPVVVLKREPRSHSKNFERGRNGALFLLHHLRTASGFVATDTNLFKIHTLPIHL